MEWAVLIGYSCASSSILIKTGAINRISYHSRQFKRLDMDGTKLKRYPLLVLIPIVTYLIMWTIFDPPKQTQHLSLEPEENQVLVNTFCSSSSSAWSFVAYLWQLILLLSAAILTYQSKGTSQELNEKQLAFLTYSEFIFLVLRLAIVILTRSDHLHGSFQTPIICILLNVNTTTATLIYFGPKIYAAKFASDLSITVTRIDSSTPTRNIPRELMFQNSKKNVMDTFGIKSSECEDNARTQIKDVMHLRKCGVSVICKPTMS